VSRKGVGFMGQVNIEENLMGFKENEDMERAVVKMQKQLNWALNNLDSENVSKDLASGSFVTADGKTVTITNGFVSAIN
jgi:hypothetical protein